MDRRPAVPSPLAARLDDDDIEIEATPIAASEAAIVSARLNMLTGRRDREGEIRLVERC